MRTTIQLDDQLLTRAKLRAAETGRTLKAVIEDALREALDREEAPVPSERVRLQTFKGRGVRHGVDLDDTSSLLDAMEQGDGAA